jgi:predicted MFS family arabinose efflux permease
MWLAYSISALGSSISFYAIMIYLYQQTGKALDIGIYTMTSILASIISGPFVGLIVDKYNRKRLMVFSNLISGILILLLVVNKYIFVVYIVIFFMTISNKVYISARMSSLPNIVKEEELVKANGLISGTSFTIRIIGPGLAGIITSLVGSRIIFVFDSVSYFIGAIIIMMIVFSNETDKEGSLKKNLLTGIKYMFTHKVLKFYVVLGIFFRLFFSMLSPLMLIYVIKYLEKGNAEYGILMMMVGIGGIIGSYIARIIENKYDVNTIFGNGLIALGFIMVLFLNVKKFYLATIVYLIYNITLFSTIINIHTNVQKITPDNMRGQVFGNIGTIFGPFHLISMSLGTFLADIFNVRTVLLTSAICYTFLSFIIIRVQRYNLLKEEKENIA